MLLLRLRERRRRRMERAAERPEKAKRLMATVWEGGGA